MSNEHIKVRGYIDCRAQVCVAGPLNPDVITAGITCGRDRVVTDGTVALEKAMRKLEAGYHHVHRIKSDVDKWYARSRFLMRMSSLCSSGEFIQMRVVHRPAWSLERCVQPAGQFYREERPECLIFKKTIERK